MATTTSSTPASGSPAYAIGGVLLAIGLALMIYNGWEVVERYTLEGNGVETLATVVDKRSETFSSTSGTQRHEQTSYSLDYEFATKSGDIVVGEWDVSSERYHAAEPGKTRYVVLYLPDDPQRHRWTISLDNRGARDWLIVGLVVGGLGAGILLTTLVFAHRRFTPPAAARPVFALGVVALLGGAMLLAIYHADMAERSELDAHGIWVDAAVYGSNSLRTDNGRQYTLRYRLIDKDGVLHLGNAAVARETYDSVRHQRGDRPVVPIVHLPYKPTVRLSRFELDDRSSTTCVVAGAILAVLAAMAFAAGIALCARDG